MIRPAKPRRHRLLRQENERPCRLTAAQLLANGPNLDRKNPRAKEDISELR